MRTQKGRGITNNPFQILILVMAQSLLIQQSAMDLRKSIR